MSTPSAPTIPHADLLEEIRAVCAATGVTKTAFGRDAVGDFSFVTGLENGRECRRKTLDRAWAHVNALKMKASA